MNSEISKIINALVDPLVSKRFEALQNTQAWLLSCSRTDGAGNEPDGFPRVVEEVVAKPLLRRFADQSEKCRCLSIRIFSEYVHSVWFCLLFTFMHFYALSLCFPTISALCFLPPFSAYSCFENHICTYSLLGYKNVVTRMMLFLAYGLFQQTSYYNIHH